MLTDSSKAGSYHPIHFCAVRAKMFIAISLIVLAIPRKYIVPAKRGSKLLHSKANKPHVVANGAFELFLELFGERGAHARSTFGSQIPFALC